MGRFNAINFQTFWAQINKFGSKLEKII